MVFQLCRGPTSLQSDCNSLQASREVTDVLQRLLGWSRVLSTSPMNFILPGTWGKPCFNRLTDFSHFKHCISVHYRYHFPQLKYKLFGTSLWVLIDQGFHRTSYLAPFVSLDYCIIQRPRKKALTCDHALRRPSSFFIKLAFFAY